MKALGLATAVVTTTLALTACSPSPFRETGSAPASTSRQPAPTPAQDTQEPNTYAWGETHQGSITTTVSAPTPFTTGPQALPTPNAPAWHVDITVTNNLDRPVTLPDLRISATSDSHRTRMVFDPHGTVNTLYETETVRPGQTVTVSVAFNGTAQAPKQVTVATEWGTNAASWSS